MNRSLVNDRAHASSPTRSSASSAATAPARTTCCAWRKRGRILDWAGESQYYVEPKRLAKLGYLDARKEPGKTRERTVYTLTDKGRQALASTRARRSPSRR